MTTAHEEEQKGSHAHFMCGVLSSRHTIFALVISCSTWVCATKHNKYLLYNTCLADRTLTGLGVLFFIPELQWQSQSCSRIPSSRSP